VIYRSPASSIANFLTFLEEWMSETEFHNNTIITGDYNINIKCSPYAEKLKTIVTLHSMALLNSEYTRTTERSATQIDLIISNIENAVVKTFDDLKISDHDLLVCNFSTYNKKDKRSFKPKRQQTRLYNKLDYETE
jgi:hypothetical protein